jgi:major type 1 subunit fimbrin (pilin)
VKIRSLVLAAASLACADSHAQNAQVNFTGNLRASTCEVSVNNSGTGDGTITLPDISARVLATPGARGGRTSWRVQVGTASNPCLTPSVQLGFRNSGNVNAAGRLRNTGAAGNVDVVLINADNNNVDINLATNANSQVRAIPPVPGYVSLNYAADYYATGQAGVGSVATSVQYDLIYP